VEYFGVFDGLFGYYVLISFRSYGGILIIDLCAVSLPMILQVLQNYASPDLYTKIHSSLSILLDLRHLPCNMKHLGKRPSQSSAMKAK
jgi:hypothetical protein